ncbi:hypothetical protein QOT17_003710 [Balamuthia mandrillaris]
MNEVAAEEDEVRFEATDVMREAFAFAFRCAPELSPRSRRRFERHASPKSKEGVPLQELQQLSQTLLRCRERSKYETEEKSGKTFDKAFVHELIRGSNVILPQPPPPPQRTKEQEEALQKVRNKLENQRYKKMVSNVASFEGDEHTHLVIMPSREEKKELRSQLSIGVNIVVSMATMFVAGFFTCRHGFGSVVAGVIGGVALATIIMIVEVWLFIIHQNKRDEKEKKKKHEPTSNKTTVATKRDIDKKKD